MIVVHFNSNVDAREWAEVQPRGTRLYMVVFEKCFKVGSTCNFAGRFYQLLFDSRGRGMKVQAIVLGPLSTDYKHHEKRIHRRLYSLRLAPQRGYGGGPREWYRRHSAVEDAVSQWIREGYSETLLPVIEQAALSRPQPASPTAK